MLKECSSRPIYKPFILVIASVCVQAMLFVNFAHALETLVCVDELNSAPNAHNEHSSLKAYSLLFVLAANSALKCFLIVFKRGRFIEVDNKLSKWAKAGFVVFYLLPSLLSILMLATPTAKYFAQLYALLHANSHIAEAIIVVIISPIVCSIMVSLCEHLR